MEVLKVPWDLPVWKFPRYIGSLKQSRSDHLPTVTQQEDNFADNFTASNSVFMFSYYSLGSYRSNKTYWNNF